MTRTLLLIALTLFTLPAQAGTVAASIKPLHSLVANVMAGDGNRLVLLADGNASPHAFSLKPSQMQALSEADLVFYIGRNFELFLDKALAALPPAVRRAPMDKISGLTIYPARLGSGFEPETEGRGGGEADRHLWLAPANAQWMAAEIARQLSATYPEHQALYAANANKLSAKIAALDADLKARLRPLQGRPFIVFHDAYQYFEKSYGLQAAGAITLRPEQAPGARRVLGIREKIRSAGVACVFREPSFDARVVDNLLEGTAARSGVLDPEGASLAPGPELYFRLMENIAAALERCLLQ